MREPNELAKLLNENVMANNGLNEMAMDSAGAMGHAAGASAASEARRLANAAAYTVCNGEPGSVPGAYQKMIEDNLVPYFEEALGIRR